MERRNQIELKFPPKEKPRLKWTPELHEHFIKAVNQLGGPYKATPKRIKHLMDIPEIGSNHLKSHLQKYRLSKHGQPNNMIYTREDGILGLSQETRSDLNTPQQNNICLKFPKLACIRSRFHTQLEAQGKAPIGYLPAASDSSKARDQFSKVYPQKACAGMSSLLLNPGKPQGSLKGNYSSGDGVEMTCIVEHNDLHWLESLEEKNDLHNTLLAQDASDDLTLRIGRASDDLTLRIGLHWKREETLDSFSKQKPDERPR